MLLEIKKELVFMLKEGFIICEEEEKRRILEENKMKNYIFMTPNIFLKNIYGVVKNEALFSLMEKYSLSYDLAKEYMKYIPYVSDKTYNDEKLDSLVSAKSYLKKMGLIEDNPLFSYRLNQFPITFLTANIKKEIQNIIPTLQEKTKVILLNKESKELKPNVYEYKSITEECYGIMNEMKKLHQEGIPYQRMYLMNMSSNHEFIFKRLSKTYNIPIRFKPIRDITHTNFAKEFFNLLKEKESFSEILTIVENSSYIKPLMALISDYSLEDKNPIDYIDFFKREFKNFKYEDTLYEDMVNVSDIVSLGDKDYAFYMGFNQGISPKIYKDEEYLSDSLLQLLGLSTSIDRNIEERNNLIFFMENTKNLYISYPLKVQVKELYPSFLIQALDLKTYPKEAPLGYSMAEDNLRLSVYMSIYDKTKEISPELTFYNVDQIPYNTYDNKFKGISKSYMEERFKENSSISLSYSTMKYYFECPFHFYCDNILKLSTFESTSATRLGTYSHAVLQDSYNNDFEFSKSTEKNLEEGIKDIELKDAIKDKFYFSQMNEILMDLISYNKRHEELSELKNVLCEEHIIYEEGNLKFHGFIDKLLYAEIDGEIYAAIMDYKTGKDYITLDNVEDGFHLQLPSYMYLLSKSERFKGKRIHIIGIYLQKVNMIALDNNLDKREQREKSFRLQGFTILDPALIIKLDPFYNKSDYIQSMMTTKNGSFGRFAKLLSEEQENDLIELVDVFIHQTRDGIMKAQFDIAPKRIKGNDVSCTFCKYKDICFKKYEDYVFLEEKKFGSEVE